MIIKRNRGTNCILHPTPPSPSHIPSPVSHTPPSSPHTPPPVSHTPPSSPHIPPPVSHTPPYHRHYHYGCRGLELPAAYADWAKLQPFESGNEGKLFVPRMHLEMPPPPTTSRTVETGHTGATHTHTHTALLLH